MNSGKNYRVRTATVLLMMAFCASTLAMPPRGLAVPSHTQIRNNDENVVDLDLLSIIECQVPDSPIDTPLEITVCNSLLEILLDNLVEAELIIDQIFVGYSNDIPSKFRNQLRTIQIQVVLDDIDGPGGVVAEVCDTSLAFFPSADSAQWAFPTASKISLDITDVPFLVLTDRMPVTVVHAIMHSLGLPDAFRAVGLIEQSLDSGEFNFVGNQGTGFGLSEFRLESGDLTADTIRLTSRDKGAHLSPLEPTFLPPNLLIRELMLPFDGQDIQTAIFVSRSLRGMFADLGYLIRGVNSPGIVDLDQDGSDDQPLLVFGVQEQLRLIGDLDANGSVDLLDVAPFIDLLVAGQFRLVADTNRDDKLDLLDVAPFIELLNGE